MIDLRSRINGKGSLWLPLFLDFISKVKIKSKELVEPGPIVPYTTQNLLLKHVCDGLDDDCHFFVNLKARQTGITTILLALDLFWLSLYPGLEGALIMDTDGNLQNQRRLIKEMLDSLPRSHKLAVVKNNRNFLELENGSTLQYLAAGVRKQNDTLGISRAYSFLHASECGAYGDPDAIKHVITTLAERNPNRLYICESTAFGFNGWKDIYDKAIEDGVTKRAFFIGWWAKEIYSFPKDSREYNHFWGNHPRFTPEEKEKIRIVKALYGFDVNDEQVAWYRAREDEYSEEHMSAKYPWHAEEAFVATGTGFFSVKRVNEDMKTAKRLAYAGYRCSLGVNFMDMEIKPATKKEEVDLRVWSEPKRGAVYCMGVDPAYGSSDTADSSVISIWRAYADRLIQVAEYATPEPNSGQCAWMIAYLAACYNDVRINIELNGPGEAVFREILHLKQQMRVGPIAEIAHKIKVGQALDSMRWFLDRKVDTAGAGWAYHFKTNLSKKNTMFNQFRDSFTYEALIARSVPLMEEMLRIRQDGDTISPAAVGKDKDDRVFAACLAHKIWADQVRGPMLSNNQTFEKVSAHEQKEEASAISVENMPGARIVQSYFRSKIAEAEIEVRRKFRRGI